MRYRTLCLVLVAAALLAGCSGKNSVGSGVNLNSKGGGGNLSLGSSTTTTAAPSAAPTTSVTAAPQAQATTTAPPATAPTTTAPKSNTYVIHIEGDSSGQPPFNPPSVAVYQGTPVQWVNADSKPHSVSASDGAFSSPSIPPGGSWTWTANVVGKHDYADGTRPYAVGTLEVAAR